MAVQAVGAGVWDECPYQTLNAHVTFGKLSFNEVVWGKLLLPVGGLKPFWGIPAAHLPSDALVCAVC